MGGKWVSRYSQDGKSSPNGFFKEDGTIYIDINAGMNGEGLILYTASHELIHLMRAQAPTEFKALADFLVKEYNEKGKSVDALVKQRLNSDKSLETYDDAFEEVIADSCESFLRDAALSEKAEQIYKKSPETANAFVKFFKKIIDKIKYYYSGIHPQSQEGRIVSEWKDSLNERLQLFIDGVNAAARNLSNKENSTNDGGVKFMARENVPVDEQDLSEYMRLGERQHVRNAKQSIVDSGDSPFLYSKQEIQGFIKSSLQGKTGTVIKAYGRVGRNLADDILSIDTDGIDVAGFYLELDSRKIEHLNDHIENDKDARNIPLSTEEVLELTEYIDNYTEVLDCVHRKDGSVRVYLSKEKGDGVVVIVELISKGRSSLQPVTVWKNTTEAFHLIWDQKKKAPNTSRAAHKSASSGYRGASNDIIPDSTAKGNTQNRKNQSRFDSDYLAAVDRGDMETAQKMVDEAAEAAGYTIKAYHGTDESFTEFDITKSRSWDGKPDYDLPGFYFSANEQEASDYGDAKGYYLSIKNPYQGSLYMLAKKMGSFRAAYDYLTEQGYDGFIDDDGNGAAEYITFSSEQNKLSDPVTYDDSGKVIPLSARFDSEKTDIRYQPRTDADLFGDMAWLDQDDDVSLLTHHFENNNEAIGEVLKKTASIEIADRTLKSKIRSVLTKYGVSESAVNGVFDEVKNILDLSTQGVEFETDETLNNITGIISRAVNDSEYISEDYAEYIDGIESILKDAKGNRYYLTDEQIRSLEEEKETYQKDVVLTNNILSLCEVHLLQLAPLFEISSVHLAVDVVEHALFVGAP